MKTVYKNNITMDPSGFVLLAVFVPHIVQEIRYYSTYNFIGERIMSIGWRNQSRIRLISLPNDTFGSE
jgi:D-alanyl-D-alanine dipeptidase